MDRKTWVQPPICDALYKVYEQLGALKQYEVGDFVCTASEPINSVFLIVDGMCKYEYITGKGLIFTLGILGKGSTFGESPCILGKSPGYDVRVHEAAKILVIDFSSLENLIYADGSLARKYTKYIITKRSALAQVERSISENNSIERFFVYLGSMCTVLNIKPVDGYYTIPFTETHKTIGEMIGCTRVTFSRIFKYLIANGYLSKPTKSTLTFNEKLLDEDYVFEQFRNLSWKQIESTK